MIQAIKPHLEFRAGNYVPGLRMTTRECKFGSLALQPQGALFLPISRLR